MTKHVPTIMVRMPSFYLNSYAPLVATKLGRIASESFSIPPFVDGSIRREPDLEHSYPAITCLCRRRKFAPRLRVDDVVAYVLGKRKWRLKQPHNKLTAVLRVIAIKATHEEGAAWYRERGLNSPNNCMVEGNHPLPLDHSHRKNKAIKRLGDKLGYRFWSDEYAARANDCGTFVICEPLFVNIEWNAPVVTEETFISVFGFHPGTQNPGKHTIKLGEHLMREFGIPIEL